MRIATLLSANFHFFYAFNNNFHFINMKVVSCYTKEKQMLLQKLLKIIKMSEIKNIRKHQKNHSLQS